MQSQSPSSMYIEVLTPERVRAIVREELAAAVAPEVQAELLIGEVARELRCSERQVWRKIALGQLRARKLAGRTVVSRAEIERFRAEAV